MDTLYEVKLTTEHRNELPDSDFGLPKDRKYPLHSEEHVRKAIQFFKYCNKNNRAELAKNINKRLKSFNMTVKVSKSNPFYDYVNKELLTESIETVMPDTETNIKDCNRIQLLDELRNRTITNSAELMTTERSVYRSIRTCVDDDSSEQQEFLKTLCNLFNGIYNGIFDYEKYEGINHDKTWYCAMGDLFKVIQRKIHDRYPNPLYELVEIFKKLRLDNVQMNYYYLFREMVYLKHYAKSLCIEFTGDDRTMFRGLIDLICQNISRSTFSVTVSDERVQELLDKMESPASTIQYLELKKNQLEKQLYIINGYISRGINNNRNTSYVSIDNYEARTIIEEFETYGLINIVRNKFKGFSIYGIDGRDLLLLKKIDRIDSIVFGTDGEQNIWYGVKNNDVFLIYKNTISETVYGLLPLHLNQAEPNSKLIRISFVINNTETNNLITEGLSIDANGNIRLVLDRHKSYMDQYQEAHRILHENYKNKNYEAMKINIAFMFALISRIERDKRYASKETDLIKARAFAVNDFKTYLGYLQKHEPNFNFVDFYSKTNFDKIIINIPRETIIGIKKLFKAIMM